MVSAPGPVLGPQDGRGPTRNAREGSGQTLPGLQRGQSGGGPSVLSGLAPCFAAVCRVAKHQTRLSHGTASPRPPEALPSGGRCCENSSVHKIPRVGRWLERHRTRGVVLLRGLLTTRKRLGIRNHGPRPGERPWLSLSQETRVCCSGTLLSHC